MTLPEENLPGKAIRAIVTDVDGTLIRRDGMICQGNRQAVARARQMGLPVILATGRIPSETAGYYDTLQLATPLVCYHGALVLRPSESSAAISDQFEPLLDAALPETVAREVVALILSVHAEAQILLGLSDTYVINRMGSLARHWDMSGPSRPQVGHLDEALSKRTYKICYYSPEAARVADIMEQITGRFAEATVCQQAHAHLCEFLAPGVSKAGGVEVALAAIGCNWDDVLAVGDYHNDVEMLRRARIGVAMGNAAPEVRQAADFVTDDRDSAGLAQAIERFVLGPQREKD